LSTCSKPWDPPFVNDEPGLRDKLGGQRRGDLQRDDLIVATVHHQRRDGDRLKVVAEIRFRERTKRVIGDEQAGCLSLPSVVLPQAF